MTRSAVVKNLKDRVKNGELEPLLQNVDWIGEELEQAEKELDVPEHFFLRYANWLEQPENTSGFDFTLVKSWTEFGLHGKMTDAFTMRVANISNGEDVWTVWQMP